MPTPIHRIAFRLIGEDPRRALRLDVSSAALDEIETRLARLDARAPWTAAVLELIAAHPGVRAPDLAARLGRENGRATGRDTAYDAVAAGLFEERRQAAVRLEHLSRAAIAEEGYKVA